MAYYWSRLGVGQASLQAWYSFRPMTGIGRVQTFGLLKITLDERLL
jgi:hypothetical protein